MDSRNTAAGERCPFAYRKGTDRNVHCRALAERPGLRWDFCGHQYDCRVTGRWEAEPARCKIRKGGKPDGNGKH